MIPSCYGLSSNIVHNHYRVGCLCMFVEVLECLDNGSDNKAVSLVAFYVHFILLREKP